MHWFSKDIHSLEIIINRLAWWKIKHFLLYLLGVNKAEICYIEHDLEQQVDVHWEIQTKQRYMHDQLQGIDHAPEKL